MTTIHEIEMQRRAFEAWQYTQNNRDRLNFHYSSNAQSGIEYEDISIDYAWQGWLAAKQPTTPQSAWISVADRLPENGTTVLCLLYNKEIISAKLDNTDWVSKYTKHLPVDDNYVEYWQPLPQPPKTSE